MTTTLPQHLRSVREDLISGLAAQTRAAMNNPHVGDCVGGNTPARTGKALEGLMTALHLYESLVHLTHTSSSETYAFRDLPEDELENYEQAKHAIKVLTMLYAPAQGEKAAS